MQAIVSANGRNAQKTRNRQLIRNESKTQENKQQNNVVIIPRQNCPS